MPAILLKKSFKYIIILLWFCCFFSVGLVYAAGSLLDPKDKNMKACLEDGTCSLSNINQTIVRVSEIILGVVGSLALLAFVAGGIMLLVSSGNKNMIEKGKATLIGAVIGLAIVFLSYTIISLVFTSMGITENPFRSNWF